MDDLNFAQNITALRRKYGITQEALADFIGVTKASVSKWETGQSFPDIQTLLLLATYY
ncbi:MAG: helix-turn-helix domain-containing protein, partial [Lachnospiraceae bacterium]|nr:helix-turn-helix domain-containing protein [Lachnospiraceae bacterium]